MARSPIAVALATATITLLITFHLISTFGLPTLGFLNIYYILEGSENIPSEQIPINPPLAGSQASQDASVYLLGVGKADITGYVWSQLKVYSC